MKRMLLGTILTIANMSTLKAEVIQLNEDQLIKESDEIIKCRGLDVMPTTQKTVVAPAPVVVEAPKEKPLTTEDIELPLRDLSPTEKLKAYRTRLEEKNLVLLEKKMELIRLQQELNLLKNLERSMNQTLSAVDSVE